VLRPSDPTIDGERDCAGTFAGATDLLETIIASAMDAMITLDDQQRVVLFNPAAERMFGFSAKEMLGRSIERLIPERFRGEEAGPVEKSGKTGAIFPLAWPATSGLRFNGEEFPMEASISQFEAGGKRFSTAILRDISERVRAEKAMHESEARKAAILDCSLDCIISIDHEGRIMEVNAATEQVLGFRAEEMLGQEMVELIIPARFREPHRRGLSHYLATGEASVLGRRIELSAMRRDGTEFPVELAISAFRVHGAPCFTGTLRDITKRKNAEKALQQAVKDLGEIRDELEERVRQRTAALTETIKDLEAFSYTLSHDLRAPVRAIHNLTRAVLEDAGGKLDREPADLLNRVVRAAARMERLIHDLLAFSRLARQEIHFRMVDPEFLLKELINERPEWRSPQAEILIQSPLLPMRANEPLLMQCLSNLLSNAVKFVPPGRRPEVQIQTESAVDKVRLSIKDNGIGIPSEAHARIFEVFTRLHDANEYEGTGIGLAIVRKAVERMGGTVGVISETDKGSLFWIELPGAPAPGDSVAVSG